jgi:hypothetical protein
MVARFDDRAISPPATRSTPTAPSGRRTRWGRIVEHEDFYEDTTRILTLENTLRELGIAPVEP